MLAESSTLSVALFTLTWVLLAVPAVLVYFYLKKINTQKVAAKETRLMSEPSVGGDLDEDFRLEFATDSEPEDFCDDCSIVLPIRRSTPSGSSESSGYNSQTDREIDWEYERFKIAVAPKGPVPDEQVLLIVTCPINKQYVKAITDEEETVVDIVTYAPVDEEDGWEWKRADCGECLEKVEESLKETGCQIPFANERSVEVISEQENSEGTGEEKEEEKTTVQGENATFEFPVAEMTYDNYDLTAFI